MIWQDIVITIVCLVFTISLYPQIHLGFKEKRGAISLWTSIPTFIGLFVIATTYLTLNLYFSAIISYITGILWFLLFLQKVVYKNK